MNWYIYLLRCKDGSLYCGITNDPQKRLAQHKGSIPGGAKYTKVHHAMKYEKIWTAPDKGNALRFEARIKRLAKDKKEALILAPLPSFDETGYERVSEKYE